AVVAVSVDGGRIQILEREQGAAGAAPQPAQAEGAPEPAVTGTAVAASNALSASPEPAPTAFAAGAGELPAVAAGVAAAPSAAGDAEEEDEGRRGKFWREDKIGLLLTMQSPAAECDPCPVVPPAFLHPGRMAKLVRELKQRAP